MIEEEYIPQTESDTQPVPIRDTESIIKRAEDFFKKHLNSLLLEGYELYWQEYDKNFKKISFPELKILSQKKYKERRFQEIADNMIPYWDVLQKELIRVKSELETNFADIVREFDNMDQYLQNYEQDIVELNEKIEIKDKIIEDLKTQLAESKYNALNEKINMLQMTLISVAQGKKLPHEYFDENIIQNVKEENKIPNEPIMTPGIKLPVSAPIEDSKKIRLQKCHEEILGWIKKDEIYPLHKVNTLEAKSYYISAWDNICFKYDLEEKDRPTFINKLDSYKDLDDNALDFLSKISTGD